MSNIKYSIIIPVYNAEKFLKECLFSVLSSDRSDIEIIAIDDGSTDNSLQILKSIQSLDHRLMIFSQKNAGVSAARNKGLLEATGEWILFLDSDDYFTTEPFNYFDWIIASHINCKVFYFSSKADKAISMDLFRQDVVLATLGTRGIKNEFTELCQFSSVWSRLYNSNDIKTNGMTFDTDLVMGEDLFFNLKIQSFVKEIVLSTFSYYFYRNNSDSITHKLNTEIPLKDYLFQHKLLKYCESNNFKKVIDLAYNKSVLEGILVSCNTCFHRYPWNQYITARRAFFQFINQEPYKTILKKKLIIATSIYYREQFYGVQNTISFFWAILFEVELLCIKIKNKKERCLMKKILTISVAAYNAARDLPKCLDSITACLNIDKIEIFIVDDGSTDATRDVALKYCIQFPQSVFLISKKNGGHGSTINASIQKSSATFFKIVDADDWIDTANLDKLIGYLEGTSADMILNPYYEVSANQQLNKKIVFPCNQTLIENRKEISIADCSNEIYLYMHSITFRTACLKKCGPIIDEHCFYVDAEYTVFPIPYVNTVACLEYPIYNYLLGTQTQSMNMKNLQKRRDQHLRVTKRLVDFYNNLSTNVSTAQKNVIRVRIIGVVILQYIILLTVDGNVGKQEIKEYDLWLNDTSPELYNLVPQYAEGGYIKVALFARKTKFIFYSVYRTILKKLHLIKE